MRHADSISETRPQVSNSECLNKSAIERLQPWRARLPEHWDQFIPFEEHRQLLFDNLILQLYMMGYLPAFSVNIRQPPKENARAMLVTSSIRSSHGRAYFPKQSCTAAV